MTPESGSGGSVVQSNAIVGAFNAWSSWVFGTNLDVEMATEHGEDFTHRRVTFLAGVWAAMIVFRQVAFNKVVTSART